MPAASGCSQQLITLCAGQSTLTPGEEQLFTTPACPDLSGHEALPSQGAFSEQLTCLREKTPQLGTIDMLSVEAALQSAMPSSFLCKCSLGMSSCEDFKQPLQWLRWLWIYSQSMAAHKQRHSPFPHPKSEPHHRCLNPQMKVEGTDMLLLFSRAKPHKCQLPSQDLHLHTFFSSGLFFQVNLPR